MTWETIAYSLAIILMAVFGAFMLLVAWVFRITWKSLSDLWTAHINHVTTAARIYVEKAELSRIADILISNMKELRAIIEANKK